MPELAQILLVFAAGAAVFFYIEFYDSRFSRWFRNDPRLTNELSEKLNGLAESIKHKEENLADSTRRERDINKLKDLKAELRTSLREVENTIDALQLDEQAKLNTNISQKKLAG